MHRILRLFAALLAVLAVAPVVDGLSGKSAALAIAAPGVEVRVRALTAEPPVSADSEPAETRPPITANDFLPEERDVTDCIGALERPGCGSESRGGWRQTLVLVAVFGGVLLVFFNVVRGVRKNRRTTAE